MLDLGDIARIAGTEITGVVIEISQYTATIQTSDNKIFTLPLQAFIKIA